jgi:hypothetical protein
VNSDADRIRLSKLLEKMRALPNAILPSIGNLLLVIGGVSEQLGSVTAASRRQQNIALQWNSAALQGVRDAKLGAPMVLRARIHSLSVAN